MYCYLLALVSVMSLSSATNSDFEANLEALKLQEQQLRQQWKLSKQQLLTEYKKKLEVIEERADDFAREHATKMASSEVLQDLKFLRQAIHDNDAEFQRNHKEVADNLNNCTKQSDDLQYKNLQQQLSKLHNRKQKLISDGRKRITALIEQN